MNNLKIFPNYENFISVGNNKWFQAPENGYVFGYNKKNGTNDATSYLIIGESNSSTRNVFINSLQKNYATNSFCYPIKKGSWAKLVVQNDAEGWIDYSAAT